MTETMKHFTFCILLFGWAVFTGCEADEKEVSASIEIKGIVTSDLGQVLEKVLVKSSQDSAFTNEKGEFTVRAYPRGALEFIKSGFVKHIEPVEEQRVINVVLKRILDGSETRFEISQLPVNCGKDSAAVASLVQVMDFGRGTGTMTWTRNKVWLLKNPVFVNAGQTLTIEAGTIIKCAGGAPDSTGSLIVARGGKLIANGTRDLPIIFTAESDSILRDTKGQICNPSSLPLVEKGLWGGLVLLGDAPVEGDTASLNLAGFSDLETRVEFGGANSQSTSGSLQHLIIRHAGKSTAALTLAGVGSGTVLSQVEVTSSGGDGFRFLGGNVNSRHLISTHNNANAFHMEKGWTGLNQFWLAAFNQGSAITGDGFWQDSLRGPVIVNATFDGAGSEAAALQKIAEGQFYKCIFSGFSTGILLENLEGEVDNYPRYPEFHNCLFSGEAFFMLDSASIASAGSVLPEAVRHLNIQFEQQNQLADPQLDESRLPTKNTPLPLTGPHPPDKYFNPANHLGYFPAID